MEATEKLTKSQAVQLARESLIGDLELPDKSYYSSQARWLIDQIAELCADDVVESFGDEDTLQHHAYTAWEIVHSIWLAGAPEVATKFRASADKPSEKEQKQIDRAHSIVWERHDPKRAFQEGYESAYSVGGDRQSMAEIVAQYLQNPWLRHPFLDWALVDMTVSRELCAFGEELKMQRLPGKRDLLGFNERYWASKGNLAKITEVRWSDVWERLWVKTFWFLIVPVGAITLAFYFGRDTLAAVFVTLYVVAIAIRMAIGVFRWGRRRVDNILGHPDPRTQPFILWNQMYEVWRLLEGPIVNPTMVRAALVKSSERGAVWDTATWSLIDRVISIDPAVWIIEPNL